MTAKYPIILSCTLPADGETPLHFASTYAYYFGIQQLIEYGADPNATNMHGQTAVFDAFNAGDECLECMKYLFDLGASLDVADNNGDTLLHFAASMGNVGCVKFLLENVALLVDMKNTSGCTPMHVAAAADQPVVIKVLVDAGATVSTKNHSRWVSITLIVPSLISSYNRCSSLITS